MKDMNIYQIDIEFNDVYRPLIFNMSQQTSKTSNIYKEKISDFFVVEELKIVVYYLQNYMLKICQFGTDKLISEIKIPNLETENSEISGYQEKVCISDSKKMVFIDLLSCEVIKIVDLTLTHFDDFRIFMGHFLSSLKIMIINSTNCYMYYLEDGKEQ